MSRLISALGILVVLLGVFSLGVVGAHKLPVVENVYATLAGIKRAALSSPSPSPRPTLRSSPAPPLPTEPPVAAMATNTITVKTNTPGLTGTVLVALRSFFPNYPQRLVEIDRSGKVTWQYLVPDKGSVIDARKLPNGDVIYNTVDPSLYDLAFKQAAFSGGQVTEVDRSGKVVRTMRLPVTHSVDVLPNGDLLLADAGRNLVTETDPTGKVVWSWDAHDHLKAYGTGNFAGYQNTLQLINPDTMRIDEGPEWLHINNAQRLPNGDTLISLRNLNQVVEVNPAGDIVWVFGPEVVKQQHCATVLPNDHLLLVDNGNARVIEVDRTTQKIVWQYGQGLLLPIQGCAYRLPSGDTLITDSAHNRVVEVTPDKQIVWDMTITTPGTAALYRSPWSPE
jgi:hypothetical protein